VVGVVVDVGFDDTAMLLEPEPHIPDNPDVASIPEVIDIPDVAGIADDVDIPDGIDMPDDIGGLPGVADVTGVVVPAAIPPLSYVVGEPNVPNGKVATVETVGAASCVGNSNRARQPAGKPSCLRVMRLAPSRSGRLTHRGRSRAKWWR
jgi:hypothetical protein